MKNLTSLLIAFALISFNIVKSQCMMTPVDLTERLDNSSVVIEGRVISKFSAWDAEHLKIETFNTVEVYKVYKGSFTSSTIDIVTEGGTVGTDMLIVTPTLELSVGDVGIFTAVYDANSTKLRPYASSQGFIKYNEKSGTAKAVFDAYDSFSTMYSLVEKRTGSNVIEFKYYNPEIQNNEQTLKATPTISNFSPTSISAGTYSLLTINGNNFGAVAGSVDFGDADDGGASYITADATLIQSWNNTQITIYVPNGASTAKIRVTNSTAETGTAATDLTITYNVSGLHSTFQQDADYTADLINGNGSGGYTFTFNEDYYLNTAAVDRYDEVIEQWRCESGINWGSNGAATTTLDSEGNDGTNIVTFDDNSPLNPGVLGTCYSYYSACGTGGVAYWTVAELDVKFDAGTNWNFTTNSPGGSEFDFYSVMLHEMGHGHQLGHVPETSDVMYWSISNGVEKRTLNANNSAAANFVMSRTNANELAYNGSTGGSTVANACGTGPMLENGCSVPPTAAFSASATSTCGASLNVSFTDESLGSPTSWSWDFGDGNTSTSQHPSNNYTVAGGYTVQLIATNANGSDTLTRESYITVAGASPVASACEPTTQNPDGSYQQTVFNVSFVGIDNTTSTSNNVTYTDYTCTKMTAVDADSSYDLTVSLNAQNAGSFVEVCHVYIDYDNNGTFDVSEKVMDVTQSAGSSGDHTVSVTIPNDAVTGTLLRMRVVADAIALGGPCEANAVSDCEDYGVFINAGPCADADQPTVSGTNTICSGSSTSLSIASGSLNDADDWEWYTGSCGGTALGSGTSVNVSPTVTTTYYVRGEGGCTTPSACGTIEVTVNDNPDLSSTGSTDETCATNDGTATVTPAPAGSYTYSWNTAPVQTNATATGLSAATYNVTVTNTATTCFASTNVIVSDACAPVVPTTQLAPSSCGITLPTTNNISYATPVIGATHYIFNVSNGGLGYDETKTAWAGGFAIKLSDFPGTQLSTTYDVKVKVVVAGDTSAYGNVCQVTTAGAVTVPTTKLNQLYCGSTLSSTNDLIHANAVAGATSYIFNVSNAGLGYDETRTAWSGGNNGQAIKLANFPGIQLNTTYDVKIKVVVGGETSAYGPSCEVTTPAVYAPAQLTSATCGKTLGNLTDVIYSNVVSGATSYIFNIVNAGQGFDETKTAWGGGWAITLSQIPGIQLSTTYDIKVKVVVAGDTSAYGQVCQVTTPASLIVQGGTSRLANTVENPIVPTTLTIYPNPNQGEYLFIELADLAPNSELIVTDIYGKQIERMNLATDQSNYNTTVKFDNKLPAGFYMVTVKSNGQSITKKLIVR